MILIRWILFIVAVSGVKKVVEETRVIEAPSNKQDPYYNKKMGKLASYQEEENLEAKVLSTGKIRSQRGSTQDAEYFFLYSGLAYCKNTSKILNWNCQYCNKIGKKGVGIYKMIINPGLDTQLIISINNNRKQIVMAFRGTISDINWMYNINFSKSSLYKNSNRLVHTGFKTIVDSMAPDFLKSIKTLIKNPKYKAYKLVLTGHSLGGALALLSAETLTKNLKIPWSRIELFTYGQPRVGNIAFVQYINSRPFTSTRVVNYNDPVPHMPPNFAGFYHHLHELYIYNNYYIGCSAIDLEDRLCSRGNILNLSASAHSLMGHMKFADEDCLPDK